MQEKKKILHIVESFGSGVFSFLVDLVKNTSKDYEIVIAHGIREETLANYKDYFAENVKFIEVKNFNRSINPIKDIKALFELKKIIKQENPNIVHLHSSKAGFLGRFAANYKNSKVFYNPHGFSFLMKSSGVIKRSIYWIIEKIGAIRKCTIIGCSKGEYEEALKLTKRSICINNGIDLENIKKDTKNLENRIVNCKNPKVCTVGRIGPQKNPELFNEIAKEFPNLKFIWIGEGDCKNALTSSNIEVTGWKSREEVLEYVNESDIFVLTSLWEGMPISLLEAMYLKKICVVSNCIGNKDVIKNGQNGLLCNNKDEFISAIRNIKNMDYESFIKQEEIDIQEIFNTERMVSEYKKVYNS